MTLQDNNYIYLLYILEQQSSWSTSRIHPSWPRSGLKLSPILASRYEHASCCHAQPSNLLFIAMVQVSHQAPSAIWVASHYIQVNITTTLHDTWHTCIYITSALLLIPPFYTSSILLGRLAVPFIASVTVLKGLVWTWDAWYLINF
jgi:hypothetical protein